MHGPSTEAARFARTLNSVNNGNEVWRQLKAFAAQYGFEHLTVLKDLGFIDYRPGPAGP